ncbi:histidine phosphatase family protein [Mycobacterium sp. KBS0706]|uniref:histidine phosphatase family protein n=1 Tax=Mycobacterium sp. KBS0706 TaxID=2578109 RepID=UPI00110FECE0|nr:histidine phosphatase family protein [Mycobacterium sp. KBS0706]TSD89207.1 histidine phosphatase family protein [Mycobacterium sp. KBS0706]
MPTRLTLICHGATAATRSGAFPADEPLEERALVRVAALQPMIRRAGRAWTSPALRARQTAAALSIDAIEEPALRDIDSGRWAGRRLEEIQAEEPESVIAWLADLDAAPHGGESLSALLGRAAAWLDARAGDGGPGIAVTHAAVIRAAILHALAAPASSFWRIDIAPLSLTELSHDGRRWAWRAASLPVG